MGDELEYGSAEQMVPATTHERRPNRCATAASTVGVGC